MKTYKFFIWATIVILILTGVFHSLSLITSPEPNNDIERQFIDTMNNYQMDMGAGIKRSFAQIFIALSACFSLVCFFGSILLWYLLKHPIANTIMLGILNIYLIFFGVLAILMWVFTFLPPIICTSLSFIFLLGARLSLGKLKEV